MTTEIAPSCSLEPLAATQWLSYLGHLVRGDDIIMEREIMLGMRVKRNAQGLNGWME